MLRADSFEELTCPEDEYAVLKAMVEAGPAQFVSGSDLAELLGVSRPTVWAKIQKLSEAGFQFEAVRNRGYRLLAESTRPHPGLLRFCFNTTADTPPVHYYPNIDSTNNEAERLLSYNRTTPFCVVSSRQEHGRGRLGRDWVSTSADNLYLSVAFTPDMPPKRLQDFTLWAGIQICRALQPWTKDAPLQIKWPNDLVCRGRKFAGMLTEAKIDADRTRTIVFGTGLNVNSDPLEYPVEIRKTATSLRAAGGAALPMNRIAADVAGAICRAFNMCIRSKPTGALEEAWNGLDALAGEQVCARRGNERIIGTARGIDGDGTLKIETRGGKIEAVRAGDVTLRKN